MRKVRGAGTMTNLVLTSLMQFGRAAIPNANGSKFSDKNGRRMILNVTDRMLSARPRPQSRFLRQAGLQD